MDYNRQKAYFQQLLQEKERLMRFHFRNDAAFIPTSSPCKPIFHGPPTAPSESNSRGRGLPYSSTSLI